MNEKPTEINTLHIKRWLDSIHETLDFYILTLQNILSLLVHAENINWHPEYLPLAAVDLYEQVLQINFMNHISHQTTIKTRIFFIWQSINVYTKHAYTQPIQ